MPIVHHYQATFKDGTTITRKSPRIYTHALKQGSWCGSSELARKASKGIYEIAPVVIIKTTGKEKPPTKSVVDGREIIAKKAEAAGEVIFAGEVRAGAWDHRSDVYNAIIKEIEVNRLAELRKA